MPKLAAAPLFVLASLAVAGCMNDPDLVQDADCERSFLLVVPAPTSDTVALYEMNNGNYSRVVAITFTTPDQAESGEQSLPGPEIRVMEGCTVHLQVRNDNALEHTLHLHGGLVPWEMDGVDFLTQMPIDPGQTFNYTFPDMKSGTYWYHCHMDGAHHIDLGMYGAFIVEERDPPTPADREYVLLLDEMDNCHVHGNADPVDPRTSEQSGAIFAMNSCAQRFLQDFLAQNRATTAGSGSVPPEVRAVACPPLAPAPGDSYDVQRAKMQAAAAMGCEGVHEHGVPPPQQNPRTWWPETLPVYAPLYNTYLVNGKAFPDTPVLAVKEGETVRIRLINAGNQEHAFHLHGHSFRVAYRDGYPLGTAAFDADTLSISPGERYDLFVEANNPGLWMIHDQNGLATMNDYQHPGGMMTCFAYDGFSRHGSEPVDAFAMQRALDCNTAAMAMLEHGHAPARTPATATGTHAATHRPTPLGVAPAG